MNVVRIATEDPVLEQWRILSQFTYPSNIQRYLRENGANTINAEVVELIAGCIRQGEAYYKAAATSPLDISPLLQYYGATNLLSGTYALLTNTKPVTANHGMTLLRNSAVRIADVNILPRNPEDGALQIFCNLFSNGCEITNGKTWTISEVIGSIPDLKSDFQNHYLNDLYYSVPVEIVHTTKKPIERILLNEIDRYTNVEQMLSNIIGFSKAYVMPQFKNEYIILNSKIAGSSIGTYSTSGRKYLQIGHVKGGHVISPDQLILMYMGLFALGFLSRYRPELWNPFVQSDQTGEKRIIEKFLSVSHRYLPNLVLNFINRSRVQFVNETEGVLDLTKTLTNDQIKKTLQEIIRQMKSNGEL